MKLIVVSNTLLLNWYNYRERKTCCFIMANKFIYDGPNVCKSTCHRDTNDKSIIADDIVACESHQYGCINGRCIYRDWLCDGVKDCPQGDDELPSRCGKFRSLYDYRRLAH